MILVKGEDLIEVNTILGKKLCLCLFEYFEKGILLSLFLCMEKLRISSWLAELKVGVSTWDGY